MRHSNEQIRASKAKGKCVHDSMASKGANTYNYSLLHKPYSSEPSEYAHREARRLHMTIEAFMAEYAHSRQQRPKGDDKK